MKYFTESTHAISPNLLIWSLAVIALMSTNLTFAADVAQAPLFLTGSVKPNVMLMLDNSGSMDSDLTVSSTGTSYDSSTSYLANVNCSDNPMPDNSTTSTRNRNYDERKDCERAGLNWSNKRCYETVTGPISYGDSVPNDFFGQTSGSSRNRQVGNQCFVASYSYTTSLSLPSGVTTGAERANYLNWYYSNILSMSNTTKTRLQVAKAASTLLVDSLSDQVRLGLATYNSPDGGKLWEVIDDLGTTKSANILKKINEINASGYTPLAETLSDIGQYFSTGSTGVVLEAGSNSATTNTASTVFNNHTLSNSTTWSGRASISGEPSFSTNPIQYSCQRSFAVLLTDGLPTKDQSISDILKDYDGDCTGINSDQCNSYDMKKPDTSGNMDSSDYLDDVAQALFKMDLRPDLRKTAESPSAKNNLTTFIIGFADPDINPDLPGVNPLPRDAAIQGGGKFYFAGNETELAASLANAFSIIIEQSASSSSVATNSTQYQTDSLVYQALFDSNTWVGDLIAYTLKTEDTNRNGILDTGEDLNGNGKIDAGAVGDALWSATSRIPVAADRAIYSYKPSATTSKGIEFAWANLDSSQQSILGSENVLNYLRGDQTKELDNGGTYRNRPSIVGDIVNSDPLYVAHNNLGYSSLPGLEGSSYNAFVASARTEMIYVAANDGMLHAFDASANANGGIEQFAYVPNAAITPTLVSLSDPNYAHKYIVDGSSQSGDVYYDNAWHTALVGSMGAGGKALFALDITNPDNFSTSSVLWEFTETDLGYTLPEASIVRLANGQWGAVVANGYYSTSGKATLYIIDIKTGAIIKKLDADIAGGNGLSSPVVVDVDDDSIADYVYAGDINGNMWKFDISDSSTANWGVANGGLALFSAVDAVGVAQPITSKPAVSKAKADAQSTGTMIYFGTGKYFETGDNVVSGSSQVQTFYGIWDKCDKSSGSCRSVVSGRGDLQVQTIIYEGISGITTLADGSTINGDVRVTSDCEVAYGSNPPTTITSPCTADTNRRGWYLDLLSPYGVQGERMVSTPVIRHGVVIFPTVIPTTQICTPGGTSWLMELEQFSGARLSGTPIDINDDGVVDDNDYVKIDGTDISYAISALKSTVGIIDTPAIINCENGLDCKYATGSSGNMMMLKEAAPKVTPPRVGARTSWQQLFSD